MIVGRNLSDAQARELVDSMDEEELRILISYQAGLDPEGWRFGIRHVLMTRRVVAAAALAAKAGVASTTRAGAATSNSPL
jgi:hypothetical protein